MQDDALELIDGEKETESAKCWDKEKKMTEKSRCEFGFVCRCVCVFCEGELLYNPEGTSLSSPSNTTETENGR